MPSLKSILSTSLLLSTTWATSPAPSLPATVPATSTLPITLNTTISTTAAPIATSSIHCDITYCVNGTSFCHFWAGISTWHMSGPSPGEVRTTLGSCKLGKSRRTAA
ncbi:uncharacterized protein TrAtP1_004151 [Trichoderma atroviride]|uniref:Uncharacterized protein n=1 Tax=Hypocrea atroviridis (strain ATCC 20476 / IMI 206040) TaxID=452589 RepID=G9P7I8_HYPAI|nr:uncharacterized protein TRIATDRAFT_28757 [Trichoderma atroviride IMI 206040]EHK42293.1 hypothetical protein TRIATDRAFT_28757 [Trichoderma atroviride IMI 206040]UKZ62920.1 hypothetical protein TrAtP1_004151 [Trichoderma atroviride]